MVGSPGIYTVYFINNKCIYPCTTHDTPALNIRPCNFLTKPSTGHAQSKINNTGQSHPSWFCSKNNSFIKQDFIKFTSFLNMSKTHVLCNKYRENPTGFVSAICEPCSHHSMGLIVSGIVTWAHAQTCTINNDLQNTNNGR